MPAGLNDAQVQNDLLIIPAAQQSGAPAGIEEAPRPDFVFAQAGSHSARLIGGASQQRISVAGSLAKVQGHVAQFWSNQGIAIEKDASDQAVETEWFSLSEKAPSDNFIARWIRSLTKSDEDIAYGRVKVELTEIAPNRVELSLDFLQLTQLEIEDQKEIDWEATGRALDNESEITFELLRHLSQTSSCKLCAGKYASKCGKISSATASRYHAAGKLPQHVLFKRNYSKFTSCLQ